MKKIFSFLLLVLGLSATAFSQMGSAKQVKWAFTSKKIGDKKYEVRMTATITGDFHMYAINAGVEGPVPTTISYSPNPLLTIQGKPTEQGKKITKLQNIKPFNNDSEALIKVSKLISGISEAFKNNKLTQLQELEYCALFYKIDLYRILIDEKKLGCTFFSEQVLNAKKGLIILQRGSDIDCLCHIIRVKRDFEYSPNIFESPFKEKTLNELKKLREKACHITIPNQEEASMALDKIYEDEPKERTFILDSFSRVQAFSIPNEIILPFKNTPVQQSFRDLGTFTTYSEIKDSLPDLDKLKLYLVIASTIHPGFEYQENNYDSNNNIVEVLLKSGLRIPIKPIKSEDLNEPTDILNTINNALINAAPEAIAVPC